MEEPIYKDVYDKTGVTTRELYMRQNGLCKLEAVVDDEGNVEVFCTDGKEFAPTSCMLNPTVECMKCITGNLVKVIKNGIKVN